MTYALCVPHRWSLYIYPDENKKEVMDDFTAMAFFTRKAVFVPHRDPADAGGV